MNNHEGFACKERINPTQYLQDQGRFMGFQQFTQTEVNLEQQAG